MNAVMTFKKYMESLFPFIKRVNKEQFSNSAMTTQRKNKRQLIEIINWIYKELFQGILKKYSLRIRKIEIEAITVTEAESQLIIEICNPTALKTSCKFAMYKQKELCNMSDKAYQSFINAGANFSRFTFHKVQNNIINIRLAGDSTNIGNNLTVLNFSFGFLNDIEHSVAKNPNSVTGNFALGVFKIKSECY